MYFSNQLAEFLHLKHLQKVLWWCQDLPTTRWRNFFICNFHRRFYGGVKISQQQDLPTTNRWWNFFICSFFRRFCGGVKISQQQGGGISSSKTSSEGSLVVSRSSYNKVAEFLHLQHPQKVLWWCQDLSTARWRNFYIYNFFRRFCGGVKISQQLGGGISHCDVWKEDFR